MRKRVLSMTLALTLILTFVPIQAFGLVQHEFIRKADTYADVDLDDINEPTQEQETLAMSNLIESTGHYYTSDYEATNSEYWYVLDSERHLIRTTEEWESEDQLTDFSVNQLIVCDDNIFVSVDNKLMELNPVTNKFDVILTTGKAFGRFALRDSQIFYTDENGILSYDSVAESNPTIIVRDPNIVDFWLDDYNTLSYTNGQTTVYSLNLVTGKTDQHENVISSFSDDEATDGEAQLFGAIDSISDLKAKFPAGKYWNHAGNPGDANSKNNQDGWTNTPCPRHGNVGSSSQTCNGFQPSSTQLSWQCMGYAEKCGYDMTGFNPRENSNGWHTNNSSSALDSLKPGDIVRYKNNGHSIYVTGVNGNTVTYTDCNSNGKCIIRWNATISKTTLKNTFSYVRVAPTKADPTTPVPKPGKPVFEKIEGVSTTSIKVSWKAAANATSYDVYGKKAGEDAYKRIAKDTTSLSYTWKDREPGTRYWFYIQAKNSSPDSPTKSDQGQEHCAGYTMIPRPTVTRTTSPAMKIEWEKPMNGVSYTIERRRYDESESKFKVIASGVKDTSYVDSGSDLKIGTKYYYRVTAQCEQGGRKWPNSVCANIVSLEKGKFAYMDAPTQVAVSSNSITINWKSVKGDSTYTYEVQRKGPSDSGWKTLKKYDEKTTTHTDKGLKANTEYQYRINVIGAVKKDGTTSTGVKSPSVKITTGRNTTLRAQAASVGTAKVNFGTYTVSFDANGGTGTMEPVTMVILLDSDSIFTLPECTFTHPDGIQFASWSIDGEEYQPGSKIKILNNVTITAVWASLTEISDQVTVSFEANGGTGSMEDIAIEKDDEWTIPQCTLIPPVGKQFTAWNINGQEYNPGNEYAETISSDITAIALWTDIASAETLYDVSFDGNGATGSMPAISISEGGEYILPESTFTAPEGMVFDSWMIDGELYVPGSSTVINSDVDVIALWKISSFSDDSSSGSDIPRIMFENKTVSSGSTIDVPLLFMNNPGVYSFSFEVEYSMDKLEYISVSDGDFPGVASSVTSNGNNLMFNYTSENISNLSGEKIAILRFNVKNNVSGIANLSIVLEEESENGFLSVDDSTGNSVFVSVAPVNGEISVSESSQQAMPGDVNGDGKVNNRDVGMLQQYLSGWKVTIQSSASDTNGDGKVNNRDVGILQQYLSGWNVSLGRK